MGVCYFKVGWFGISIENYIDCLGLSISNFKLLIYELLWWLVDIGDKGKFVILFYKRWRWNGGNLDFFIVCLEGFLGGIYNFYMKYLFGDIIFVFFVGILFVRNLEMEGMDVFVRLYVIFVVKVLVRNIFLFL